MKIGIINFSQTQTIVADYAGYYTAFGLGMKIKLWKESIIALYGEEVVLQEEIGDLGDISSMTISKDVDIRVIYRYQNERFKLESKVCTSSNFK